MLKRFCNCLIANYPSVLKKKNTTNQITEGLKQNRYSSGDFDGVVVSEVFRFYVNEKQMNSCYDDDCEHETSVMLLFKNIIGINFENTYL